MLQLILLFVNRLLQFDGFKRSDFSDRAYRELVTALNNVSNHDVVMISHLINKYKSCMGRLIIDTTDNPKYGLDKLAIKMMDKINAFLQQEIGEKFNYNETIEELIQLAGGK